MIKLENEKLSELIIVWYNGRHSQLNLCIEVNVYSYIALNTGALFGNRLNIFIWVQFCQ